MMQQCRMQDTQSPNIHENYGGQRCTTKFNGRLRDGSLSHGARIGFHDGTRQMPCICLIGFVLGIVLNTVLMTVSFTCKDTEDWLPMVSRIDMPPLVVRGCWLCAQTRTTFHFFFFVRSSASAVGTDITLLFDFSTATAEASAGNAEAGRFMGSVFVAAAGFFIPPLDAASRTGFEGSSASL